MGEVLAEGPALVGDPAWLEGPALEDAVQPLQLVAEVDWEGSVDIFVLFVAVSRWDGGFRW